MPAWSSITNATAEIHTENMEPIQAGVHTLAVGQQLKLAVEVGRIASTNLVILLSIFVFSVSPPPEGDAYGKFGSYSGRCLAHM